MKLSVLIYTDTKINLCVASGKTKKIYTTKEEVAFLFLLFMSVVYSVCVFFINPWTAGVNVLSH